MISLQKCREILGEKGKHLSDEQLESYRKTMIELARINMKIIQEQKNKKK